MPAFLKYTRFRLYATFIALALIAVQALYVSFRQVERDIEVTLKRPPDQFACYGGEEFVLLAPFTDSEGARQLAERVREGIAQSPLSKAALRVTVSIGVAEAGQPPAALIDDNERH